MSHKVIMPVLGMNQDNGIIAGWSKQEGDFVEVGDALMEIETDKAIQEIEAGVSGYLCGIKYPAGAEVPVGETVALIVDQMPVSDSIDTEPHEPVRDIHPERKSRKNKPAGDSTPVYTDKVVVDETGPTREFPALQKENSPGNKQSGEVGRIPASPKAKYIAGRLGLEINQVAGETDGPIHGEDVIATAKNLVRIGWQERKKITSPKTSARITIQVDATNIKSCDSWLREKTPDISMGHLVAALAVSQLRVNGNFKPNASIRVLVDIWSGKKIESSIVENPDQSRVSQIQIQNHTESEPVDMHVICITNSQISDLELAENVIPTLIIFVDGENLSAHVSGFESMFSSSVMRLSENLAYALEQPLLHLV